jgi:CubicO group peptidase (beta-lactamase class C family)
MTRIATVTTRRRRSSRRPFSVTVALVSLLLVLTPVSTSAAARAMDPGWEAGPSPLSHLSRTEIGSAIETWEPLARTLLAETGVPGMAVAIVFEDEVVYAGGFGTTDMRTGAPVGPGTVFQLASLSKPIASTVVAALVGNGVIGWADPIVGGDPGFALAEPYVTANVTFADLTGLGDWPVLAGSPSRTRSSFG